MAKATTTTTASNLVITFKDDDAVLLHDIYRNAAKSRVDTVRILAGYVAGNVSQKVVAESYVAEIGDYSTASVLQWLQGYAFACKAGVQANDESVTLAIKSITSTTAKQRNAVTKCTPEEFGAFVAKAKADTKRDKAAAATPDKVTARPGTATGKNANPEQDAPTVTPESGLVLNTVPLAVLLAALDSSLKSLENTPAYEAAVIAASKVVNRHKVRVTPAPAKSKVAA